jgi:hypothetical protein
LVVLFGLPVIALVLGWIFGGSLHPADLGLVLIKQLGSILLAVVVINLWEETVWAGFFQTRLEARFNFVVAAVLTTLPFAGVHIPLLLLDDQVSVLSVLIGIAGFADLGNCRSAADGCRDARRLRQRVGSRDLASDLRCQQQQRRPGRFLTGWRRCRQHDPACRRHTDSAGRRVAALATSWRMHKTSNPASRFPAGGWATTAGAVTAEAAGPLVRFLRWCRMALVVASPLIVVATLLHPVS